MEHNHVAECIVAGIGAHLLLHVVEWVLLVVFGISIHHFIHKWEVKDRVSAWWEERTL